MDEDYMPSWKLPWTIRNRYFGGEADEQTNLDCGSKEIADYLRAKFMSAHKVESVDDVVKPENISGDWPVGVPRETVVPLPDTDESAAHNAKVSVSDGFTVKYGNVYIRRPVSERPWLPLMIYTPHCPRCYAPCQFGEAPKTVPPWQPVPISCECGWKSQAPRFVHLPEMWHGH